MRHLQTYKLWERLQDKRVPDETLVSLQDILLSPVDFIDLLKKQIL